MIANLQGKAVFLGFIFFFIGWALLSIRNENQMTERLRQAEAKFEEAVKNHNSTIETLEAAYLAKEKILKEYQIKNGELENALDNSCGWDDIYVPDNVTRMLDPQSRDADKNSLSPTQSPAE